MNYHVSRWRLGSGSQASEGGGARGWGDDRQVSGGDPLGQEAPFLFLSFLCLSDSPFCSPFLTLFHHVFSEKGEKCEKRKKVKKKSEKRANRKARERKASWPRLRMTRHGQNDVFVCNLHLCGRGAWLLSSMISLMFFVFPGTFFSPIYILPFWISAQPNHLCYKLFFTF